jgi:hypothetical protein
MWKSLIEVLGALPATVLASFAAGVIFGGIRSLASAEPSGALFVTWGLLGIAGAAGLWLAAIEGALSRVAAVLIGCGLAADAALVALPLVGGPQSVPFRLRSPGITYWLLTVLPFSVGAIYVGRVLFRKRQTGAGRTAV